MRIALVSSYAPFVLGGARNIVDWLVPHLEDAGHEVEVVNLPFSDNPDKLFSQLGAFRTIDLTEKADLVVCFRPPSYFIRHPRKVIWFIHHLRNYYDLWETEYQYFPNTAIHRSRRDAVRRLDNLAFAESTRIFTNSEVVRERLRNFNDVDSEVLYPPIHLPERYHNSGYDGSVVYLARLEHHKRQHLAIEALTHTTTEVTLTIAGLAGNPSYAQHLKSIAKDLGVADRVTIEDRWISDEEKVKLLAGSLALAYFPVDEDSYGYPSIEAAYSSKAIITTTDAGGVLELVQDKRSGIVVSADAKSIATAMDRLHGQRELAQSLGENARSRVDELGISWQTVVERIVS